MKSTSAAFESNAVEALLDPDLQASLNKMGFRAARQRVVDEVPEWEAIRAAAREIKEHTLAHLDYYLVQFESKVVANGGHVHWASTPEEAQAIVEKVLCDISDELEVGRRGYTFPRLCILARSKLTPKFVKEPLRF